MNLLTCSNFLWAFNSFTSNLSFLFTSSILPIHLNENMRTHILFNKRITFIHVFPPNIRPVLQHQLHVKQSFRSHFIENQKKHNTLHCCVDAKLPNAQPVFSKLQGLPISPKGRCHPIRTFS